MYEATLDHMLYQKLCYTRICEFGHLQKRLGKELFMYFKCLHILYRCSGESALSPKVCLIFVIPVPTEFGKD